MYCWVCNEKGTSQGYPIKMDSTGCLQYRGARNIVALRENADTMQGSAITYYVLGQFKEDLTKHD